MAERSGKDGSVTFTGASGHVYNWAISLVGDTLETTDFDDSSGGRSYIPGLIGWSGSFDCRFSTGNYSVPGTNATGTIVLRTKSTGDTGLFTGDIIITGMDVGSPVDGIVSQAYTFQGTGPVGTTV